MRTLEPDAHSLGRREYSTVSLLSAEEEAKPIFKYYDNNMPETFSRMIAYQKHKIKLN